MPDDETPTKPSTPVSKSSQFPPVDCPLCFHQDLWRGSEICPGCRRLPDEILESGAVGKISPFKVPGLFAMYPELASLSTVPEMPAVRPEEEKK